MEAKIFNNNTSAHEFTYSEKPILYIGKVTFQSEDKSWYTRFNLSNLIVKITCLKNSDKEAGHYIEPINLGSFILPTAPAGYHSINRSIGSGGVRPIPYSDKVIDINRFIRYGGNFNVQHPKDCEKWKVNIELTNLEFQEGEELKVEMMDQTFIKRRVDNWIERVNNLFAEITKWYLNNAEISIKEGRPVEMYEELMQNFDIPRQRINTVNFIKNNNIILSFKPIGLWVIGANGRIDMLSKKGSFLLLDEAEQFQKPKWKIYPMNNKMKGEVLTKDLLNKLIASLA